MKCPYCGSEVLVDTLICEHCGRDAGKVIDKWEDDAPPAKDKALKKPMFSAPLPRGPSRPTPPRWGVHEEKAFKTLLSMAGGALVFAGGFAAVVEAVLLLYLGSPSTIISSIPLVPLAMGSLMLMFGFIAMAGGVLGVMRIQWSIVLFGAICSTLALGWYYLSLLLGIIGIIVVGITREEFD